MTKTTDNWLKVARKAELKRALKDRFRLARGNAYDALRRKHYRVALRLFTSLATKKDLEAQLQLVKMYRAGKGCTADAAQSAYWLQRVNARADGGSAEAQWALHDFYLFDNEFGIPLFNEASNHWLRAAAESGHPEAMYELAMRYEYGYDGFEKNVRKARSWLTKAVAARHPQALVQRSFSYFRNGKPTKRAVALLEKAVKLGSVEATEWLVLA